MKIFFTLLFLALFISCNNQQENGTEEKNTPQKEERGENSDIQKEFKEEKAPSEVIVDNKRTLTDNLETKAKTKESKLEKGKNDLTKDKVIAKDTDDKIVENKMIQVDFSGVYDEILRNFVSASGKVNYANIKITREMLRQATQHFEENPPQSSWSRNEKLAYWINAYNLYTIELIVDNYPVKSIKDIAGGKPWDKKFIQLAGRNLSLNDIENGIIRKEFDEPRIHFAVNCASISCPKLLNKAYTASNLNSLLEAQTKRFINDKTMNSLSENSVEISNLFDWYSSDFGNVVSFLNKYAEIEISPKAKISYKEYNWNLNN